MRSCPNPIYRLLHKDYPESFSTYSPQKEDFHDFVLAQLPGGWRIQREGIWFYCSLPMQEPPLQGWKIHLSATLGNSREVLGKTIAVLLRYKSVSFKFAADRAMLSLLNSKTWPRNGAGKFITIYPADSGQFLELIEELSRATAGMQGPYILSDQQYKKSRVVFYRYGGMRAHTTLNVKGEKVPVLVSPEGALVPDHRQVYPVTPAWAVPVLPEQTPEEQADMPGLLHGRYTIENALAFSSAGGVYLARDHHTEKKVIVKESRPHINAMAGNYDAIELLKKEYRLLQAVADLGIAPYPIDLFPEWEHWFLVQEYIEGMPMGRHSAASNLLLRTRVREGEPEQWWTMFSRFCADLVGIVDALHRRNVVFADLSPNNLIVTADQKLKIIDFEGAQEEGVDLPTNIYTPGFGSSHRVTHGQPRRQDDYYSAGAVLLAYLLPINGLLHLDPQARHRFIASIQADFGMPGRIACLINRLMDHPEQFCSHDISVDALEDGRGSRCEPRAATTPNDYQPVLDGILTHLAEAADYSRKDRLYPADARIFNTNPLSLAYGAAGVAYAIHRLTGKLPEKAVAWMMRHKVTAAEYPPGLYTGMSGIAWSFLEMGLIEAAEEIFQASFHHPLAGASPDLFYGLAGCGMTALRFFIATGNELYLNKAREAGEKLIGSSRKLQQGQGWTSSGPSPLGLAHGSSGIALFLLYLYLATHNERYLNAGRRALDCDLSAAVATRDGGLSWPESTASSATVYPYWRFGSAGIGTALRRFQSVVACPRYDSILNRIFIDTDRKYAVFPGRFNGLAGMGGFLLDLHEFTGEARFRESANHAAEGIMHFLVKRGEGSAFPGELLCRLCCDYGTGSAGIALFLNRLIGRQGNDFMLDTLFEQMRSNSPVTFEGFENQTLVCLCKH
jgi:class III lanthionine synthetase